LPYRKASYEESSFVADVCLATTWTELAHRMVDRSNNNLAANTDSSKISWPCLSS